MLNIVVDVLPYFCYHFEADVSVKLMHIFVLFLLPSWTPYNDRPPQIARLSLPDI